jgi:integrase
MKIKLTNVNVQALTCDAARPLVVHDEECRGFCVSVSKTGKKLFQFYGRVGGRPRRVKIGEFPAMNVADARRRAREIIGDVARGKDPAPWRSKGVTLREAFASYMTLHAKESKRTAGRDIVTYEKWLKPWGGKLLKAITRADCGHLIESMLKEGRSKSTVHKARALLSSICSFAIRQGWIDSNPVHLTHRPSYAKRERYLRPEEVKAFFEALGKVTRETTRDFIAMVLWTGQRRSNVGAMRFDEIDMVRGVWTIPMAKFKGKRAHVVPLIPEAMEIVGRRKLTATSVYVFPGGGSTGHIVEPKAAFGKLRADAGLDIRLHDLRRTLGAWQNAAGTSLRTIQQGLGHSDIRTTASVYTPVEVAAVREAMEAYAMAMKAAASPGSRPD